MRYPLLPALLAALLLACGAPPAPAPGPATPAPAPSAAQPPAAASTAAGVPAPQPAAPPQQPEPPSPFHPAVIHAPSSLHFYPLGTIGLAVAGDYFGVPIRVDDRGARIDRSLFKGLKGGEENVFVVLRASGDWPRQGTLSLNIPGERGGTDVDYEWNGSSWVLAKRQLQGDMPHDVSAAYYLGGFNGSVPWGERTLYSISTQRGDAEALIPRFVLGGKGRSAPAPVVTKGKGDCPTRLVGYLDLRALPSGDLAGVGKLCTRIDDYQWMAQSGPGALAVERWPRGATTSIIEELPDTAERGTSHASGTSLLSSASGGLYVTTAFHVEDQVTPYIAHHDGKAWKNVTPKITGAPRRTFLAQDGALWLEFPRELLRLRGGSWERLAPEGASGEIAWSALGPDGALWAVFGPDLWRWDPSGAWSRVPLPRDDDGTPRVAESAAWLGPDDMVIVAQGKSGGTALLRSKKPAEVLDLAKPQPSDDVEDQAKPPEKPRAFARVTPPTAACKDLFVVLYKLSKVAPADYDFPLTRDALKGHTEYSDVTFAETEDAGRRYLVAFVPSLEKGRQLAALIRDKVKGSTPQLLCGRPPQTNRALKIDLRTGALLR